jgi:hypothetical protein
LKKEKRQFVDEKLVRIPISQIILDLFIPHNIAEILLELA